MDSESGSEAPEQHHDGSRSAGSPRARELADFWQEPLYATLTTHRPDGTPHVVPVSVTYEPGAASGMPPGGGEAPAGGCGDGGGTARVVASRGSKKVRNVLAAGPGGARVALCQVDRFRWSTLEGRARIRTEPEAIADAEQRFAQRYGRSPRPNPERVLMEIAVDRVMASRRLRADDRG